jgi:UDP:flavonoid glycosyltransferase YjiC (YdhE family)
VASPDRRRRFLFVTWNGGGNVPPAVALAVLLRGRGHDVRALGPASLAERFGDEGIAYRAHRSRDEWSGGPVVWPAGPTEAQRRAYHAGMAADVLAELGRAPTDVAVVDYMQPDALCAVERAGIACVAFVHTLHRRIALSERSPMSMGASLDDLHALRRGLGLAPIERSTELLDRAARVLVVTARQLDGDGAPLASNVCYVGPIVEDAGADAGWQPPFPDDARPLVVVSMGTTPMNEREPLQRILDALATLPVRGFATVGHHLDPAELQAGPNTRVSRYVRHAAVLPHARVLVTHAGLSSIGAALACGVPMLCVPLGRDQPVNAEQVRALGAGLTLSPQASPGQLGAALRELLGDERFAAAARGLAIDGSGARAADVLEERIDG